MIFIDVTVFDVKPLHVSNSSINHKFWGNIVGKKWSMKFKGKNGSIMIKHRYQLVMIKYSDTAHRSDEFQETEKFSPSCNQTCPT